jgi:hypothetical protein
VLDGRMLVPLERPTFCFGSHEQPFRDSTSHTSADYRMQASMQLGGGMSTAIVRKHRVSLSGCSALILVALEAGRQSRLA